jgi:GrpB-like predicted nucleotidyltransferase (UPF0157 family)
LASDCLVRNIVIVDYDPAWPIEFSALRSVIVSVLGDIAVAVEHVGSTSVPGLAAKPIIDIDVVVASVADVAGAINRLAEVGYNHRGNLGVDGREAFSSPPESPQHHLYVCVLGNTALQNHLMLRDYLRAARVATLKYSQLKRELAARYPTDVDKYIDGKTEFILTALRKVGLTDQQSATSAINRPKV